jgi:hypothetical protein
MRSLNTASLVVALTAALSASCLGHHLTFDHLRGADRVEVTTRHQRLLKTIREPAVISAASEAVARHDAGWEAPWHGTPVVRLQVSFFRGDRLVGGYGVGKDFLTTDPGPALMSRSITPEEAARIAQVLGLTLPEE